MDDLFLEQLDRDSSTENQNLRSHYFFGFILLAGVSLILGSSFPVIKQVVGHLSPQLLTTLRFFLGALVLSPLLSNLNRSLIRDGLAIGLIFFCVSLLECTALEGISASRAGFTFALSIIFVTLFEILRGKSFSLISLISAVTAFTGIALMSWQSGEPLVDSIWMIFAAILDSAYIIVIERAVTVHSPLKLTAVSCWIPAILGLIWSAPELVHSWRAIADNIWELLYLGGVGITLVTVMETIGQQWIPGNEVAIFRTLEPLTAAFLSFWFLGETFNRYDYIGSAIVLSSILLLIFSKGRKLTNSHPLEKVSHSKTVASSEEEREPTLQS